MEYLKRHYEKILLSIVLLFLAGAAGYLIYQVSNKRQELKVKEQKIIEGTPKSKLKPLDDARYRKLLELGKTVEHLELGKNHHVFNPVTWVRKPNGEIVKIQSGNEIGLRAAVVTKITPLHLTVDMIATGTAERPTYSVGVTREYSLDPNKKKKQARTVSLNNKVVVEVGLSYVVKEIKGTYPDVELAVDLTTGEETQTISLSKGKPYQKVMVYTCDLRYPPDNINYPPGQRENNKVVIAGEEAIISAIKPNEVTLQVPSTQQRTTLPFRP